MSHVTELCTCILLYRLLQNMYVCYVQVCIHCILYTYNTCTCYTHIHTHTHTHTHTHMHVHTFMYFNIHNVYFLFKVRLILAVIFGPPLCIFAIMIFFKMGELQFKIVDSNKLLRSKLYIVDV